MALPHAFSLQDSSLLSGIEPLPLSSPPSPRHSITDLCSPPLLPSPSLRRAVSSQVTAQLYASLRRSQEVDEEEEIHQVSGRTESAQGPAMTSKVEELADELSVRLQEGVETSWRREPSPYITQMESLRCHLKTMLSLGSTGMSHGEAAEKRLEQQSDTTSALLSAHLGQDLSPPLSLAGLEGLFPRYSTLYNAPLPDLQLRDALDKETARRKHLERHIQNLQSEMLELQQGASVMLAADRRKDCMIQQLDQTLALVVGGWKQQEHQREETMRRLGQEKEEAEQARTRDQEILAQVEQRLAEAMESLGREQVAAKEQQTELQRQVEEQKAHVSQLQIERKAEEEAREQERRELETLQQRAQEQQRSWEQRELELQEECRRVQDRGTREVEKEKAFSQQETQKSQQLQLALAAQHGEVLRLERELQTSHRERDTLQMELNLEKARNESEKVRIESEHKMRVEEVMTERLGAIQEESAQHLCTVRDHHRKQLLELTSQHEAELCRQMSQFKGELQEREQRHRDIVVDLELKLSRSEEHCQELSRSLRRLESERADMLSQLQDVMKSHWSQTLRVLAAKVPSESSTTAGFHQQTETSDQWTSQLPREVVYGEETSVPARRGIVEADNLPGIGNLHLKDSTDSRKETHGHFQRGGSQPLEDSHGGRRVGDRFLTDSRGSDLIHFNRIMDEKSQSLIKLSSVNGTSQRFLGDGAHVGNDTGLSVTQSDSHVGHLGNAPGTPGTTSLFRTKDLHTLQDILASYTIGKYIAGQSVEDKSQCFTYPEMTSLSKQSKNTSDNAVTGSVILTQRDSRSRLVDDIHQSLTQGNQHIPSSEKNTFSQYKSSGAYSFTTNHKQPQSTVQIHHHMKEDSAPTTPGVSNHLREASNPTVHPSLDQAPITVPNFSPISKMTIQGNGREIRIPATYRERQDSSHQPSNRVCDPEESFYPMQMEELSHSFSSYHGFFPLEPHPDGTMTTTVSTAQTQSSQNQPGHTDPANASQMTSNWGRDEATANPVLQYYIRMLLDRTPGDPLNELNKGLLLVNPDATQLSQSLQRRGDWPLPRSDENEEEVSKLLTNPKKNPARVPEAVKKQVLSSQRRSGPPKPLKRVAARGGRPGIWK
ncbi:centrobin isoform X2 [Dendrobates tinctorius]|uniref:centrobin isoform X2 n=1 Tax=Dendrobates tinctorius TaxID=92724 RepID=UPI003CC980F7